MIFKNLFDIDSSLLPFLKEIEKHFLIVLDQQIIEKIFADAKEDQVSEKKYVLYESKSVWGKRQIRIDAIVDEYEPESIWIEIQGIKDQDIKFFNSLVT